MPKASAASGGGKRSEVFGEDVVKFERPGQQHQHAVVIRCWADEQDPEVRAEAERMNSAWKPLPTGQIELMFPYGVRETVSEDQATIVDRGFIVGDLVRAAGGKGQAGVITHIAAHVKVERVLTREKIEGWVPVEDLMGANVVHRSDHVVHGGWIGMVEEVLDLITCRMKTGEIRKMCDTSGPLSVGMNAETLALGTAGGVFDDDIVRGIDQVLDVQQIALAVNWLCTNQLNPPSGRGAYNRPQRVWTKLDELTLIKSAGDHMHSISDKMQFKDPARSRTSPAPLEDNGPPAGPEILVVTECKSTCEVIWQDGTTTTASAPAFEHCLDPDDDIDCLPGDVGMFTGDGSSEGKPAVVQSMSSKKRTMKIKYFDTNSALVPSSESETVSCLEFDPHGPPPEFYGLKRQDIVLIAQRPTGDVVPNVSKLGESETLVGDFPDPSTLRLLLAAIGQGIANNFTRKRAPLPIRTKEGLEAVDWYGTVVGLGLDGKVKVVLPSGAMKELPLTMLYRLDDGLDEPPPPHDHDHDHDHEMGSEDGSWIDDEDDVLEGESDWEDREADEMQIEPHAQPVLGWADEGDAQIVSPPRVRKEDVEVDEIVLSDSEPAPEPSSSKVNGPPAAEAVAMPKDEEDHPLWTRFQMLEEAPADHHYINQPVVAPPKAYTSRVHKEHSVLASSLPPNVLVRVYEDRIDLMRCLIIGPVGTPFANAPFLFDVCLPPAKFPTEPPLVFFWNTGGGGTRVSPNLYTEGKVCLSLLGTWNGDKIESWSAARSSILQVFVSIQSLIMTEHPYYTEPGFEKQMGTLEGEKASDLYNERTFTLTRNFVKRAVEFPFKDFEQELKAYFVDGLPSTGPGALKGIVEQSKALLEESEKYSEQLDKEREDDEEEEVMDKERPVSEVLQGLRVLTEGAALSLRRTVAGLDGLLSVNQS